MTLAAVVAEVREYVGGKVQRISQLDDFTVVLGLYKSGTESYLLLSCHPQFARMYFTTRRPGNAPQPPQFCAALRSRLDGAMLVAVEQINFDRIIHLHFAGAAGEFLLIVELMGKHSNLMLVDEGRKVVGAAKWVGKSKSSRPITPGTRYEPPPTDGRPSLLDADPGDVLKDRSGASPFILKLIEAMGEGGLETIRAAVEFDAYSPVLSPGHGAYPITVAALDLPELSRSSISIALEQHFAAAIPEAEAASLKASLRGQLERVLLARETALSDLQQALDAGLRAGEQQLKGELILAYGANLREGASVLEAFDYEGNQVSIKLDPELGFKENANRYFEKAKHAKARLGMVRDQMGRLEEDRVAVEALLARVEETTRLDEVRQLHEEAGKRRWLHKQPVPTARKEDRPYEGHRIRELIGPGGVPVLYGENAESNDYLTLRVAKPNDWWIHVRGGISAHVVIPTRNHPEKVSREVILFAGKVAVQNSPSKHSGYVPVDYTLRKYVRKPRGAPKGTALYTHEKTIHIEGST